MIVLKPGIFSNCLSAVTIGKSITIADAAMMASGSLIFIFCLISITFFLITEEISTTVHWLINAFVLALSSDVMLGLLSSSSSVMKESLASIPCNNSAKCSSPLSRYMAMLVSQKACKSIPFIAHSFLSSKAVFFPFHRAANFFGIQFLSLFQFARSACQVLLLCFRSDVYGHNHIQFYGIKILKNYGWFNALCCNALAVHYFN
jgi:hypothetical protein